MIRSTRIRILASGAQSMIIDVIFVHMMHVPIVQVIGMSIVLYGRVAAIRTMTMRMALMFCAGLTSHDLPPGL